MTLKATKITPNLIVSSVERSLAFYTEVRFLNDRSTTAKESPQMAGLATGGGNTMFIEVEEIDALHDRVAPRVHVLMPIATQWYGMREFAFTDPDGYVITFAQRVTAR